MATTGLGAIGVLTEDSGTSAGLTGTRISTQGADALGLVASTGGTTTISGVSISTGGAGASGLVAFLGGVINATGPTAVTTGVSSATGFGANGVVADGASSQVNLAAATITTSGPGAFALAAVDSTSSGSAGAITASGTLTIKTTNASDVGVALQGDGASVLATGGGSITAAGDAIAFLGGKNQVATFDNFTIGNQTGDLIFADPSIATVNFNASTANAGNNNLLDATSGSSVTLNASASTLTGAIKTDATSTTAVNLTNGSTWTMPGSSIISNLAVTNSVVVFAPPSAGGGFKTLTLGNYVGSGANIAMNATLGGIGSASDQIVINGGKATGTTLLTIHNVGGTGGATVGPGIPLVIAENGGSIAPNAFALASTPVAGGFKYTLQESGDDWYLVSSPTSTTADIANSITDIARAQQKQIITNRVLTSILLGATEQISCSNCSSGFGSIGSYAIGAHGRWNLSDELTVMGGFSYDEYSASGITVTNAPMFAGALVYDPVNFGRSRPFVEIGGGATPYEEVKYTRSYPAGDVVGVGYGRGVDRSLALFGRIGWVDRITPIDEATIYGDISRTWLVTGGYTEAASGYNPYPATVANGLDTLNVARVGGQYTHLFNGKFETNVSLALAYGFDAGQGSPWNVASFGPVAPYSIGNSTWLEWGGRIGYRATGRMVVDAFLLGTVGGTAGNTVHGGVGLRYLF